MSAVVLARMGVKFFICDSTDYAGHQYGRGDAIQPRVMEIWQSLGLPFEQAEHVGKKVYGRAFWEMGGDAGTSTRIATARLFPAAYDYDKNYALLLRQGLVEQILLDDAKRHNPGLEVHWNTAFVGMGRDKNGVYDIELKSTLGEGVSANGVPTPPATPSGSEAPADGTTTANGSASPSRIRAKYVLAADGARSAVRRWAKPLGAVLQGDLHSITWCVLDAVRVRSNHPDLEKICINRSPRGIVLVIPREPINGKPSCRFDIQIENKSRVEATQEDAVRMIKAIFHPFSVEWDEVSWWSSYDVSQRLINTYSVNDNSVFFMGDCCHTHSPRTGLGLNTATMEAHNLCWKLGYVAKGLADPAILDTYAGERFTVAEKLIRIDRTLVAMYAGLEREGRARVGEEAANAQTNGEHDGAGDKVGEEEKAADWLQRLHKYQMSYAAYQAGASIAYPPSVLAVGADTKSDFDVGRPGIAVGARLKPAFATRVSDMVVTSVVPRFDGRFTIFVLAGDLTADGAVDRLLALDDYISSTGSIFAKYAGSATCGPRPVCEPLYLSTADRTSPIPPGRRLYTHDYTVVPQISGAYHAPQHGLFRVAVATTTDATHPTITQRLYPKLHPLSVSERPSHLFAPLGFYCDDQAVLSPYRESFPEAGSLLEHPLHEKWGVGAEGSIVVGRPDGHVGMIAKGCGVEVWKEVEAYFAGFMKSKEV
ncbi:FAD/NAD(P)-binding domain-containing protein [Schizophyllum commune Tattone D]|nr:FAD/NAD(P)-binding domain-containing protein [Schizophyllum commune Tattone D]